MTVVRKYPTVRGATSAGWTGPDYLLNVENNVCAMASVPPNTPRTMVVSNFGFAIPSAATIVRVTIGLKAASVYSGLDYLTQFCLQKGLTSECQSNTIVGGSCALSAYQSGNLVGLSLSVDDLNNETFVATVKALNTNPTFYGFYYVDSCYIEVEYTIPSVAGGGVSGNSAAIAVFAGIQGWIHRRKKRRFITTLK